MTIPLVTGLYAKGRITGQQRGKRNVRTNTNLIQIEGVANKEEAQFYLGKRIAYVYTAQKAIDGSKVRIIWGKVTRSHGNGGMVRAQFRKNLPPVSFGHSVRIMLYPSNI
ncbi:60S ribosomal protein L33A [Microbotryomycetes sp. NB124-2]